MPENSSTLVLQVEFGNLPNKKKLNIPVTGKAIPVTGRKGL
jgi:hypothetical protein